MSIPLDAPWDGLDLVELLTAHPADRVAVVRGEERRTYGELIDGALRAASVMRAHGVVAGDRVGLVARNRIEYYEIELAAARVGAVLVAMSWRYMPTERADVVARSAPRMVIADDEFARELRGRCDVARFDEIAGAAIAREVREPREGRRLSDAHEIIFTSGTTGSPKGAVWTLGGLVWNAMQQIVDFGIGPDAVVFVPFDLNYIGGRHQFVWGALLRGGTVHIKESGGFDAAEVVRLVHARSVTHMLLVPTMIRDLLAVPDLDPSALSSLRMVMTGGAPVTPDLLRAIDERMPGLPVVPVYGLTEGGGSVTHLPLDRADDKVGSAGRASIHARIRIAPGVEGADGEIEVFAPTLCAGYWNDPIATADLFHDGWLRTGDLGHLDSEGFLFVTGRSKELIISGGMNIFPSEIVAVLERHPAVRAAAVFGVPHERWGEAVCAVVEVTDSVLPTEEELIALCRAELASYKKPMRIIITERLPRTASGKIATHEAKKQWERA